MKTVAIALVGVLVGSVASAQGFLDVNAIRVQPAEHEAQNYANAFPLYREFAGFAASYPKLPAAVGLDVSGGFVSRIGLGVQIQVDYAEYKGTVGLGVDIPSPYFFNTEAIGSGATSNPLTRQQIGVNLGAVYKLPLPSDRVVVRVFGGPTYFNLRAEMVDDITYSQRAGIFVPTNSVTITGYDSHVVTGSAIGYHIGADVAWFFSRHVGVGGVVHFSHGVVTVAEPITRDDADLKVGSTTVGGGLRLRF